MADPVWLLRRTVLAIHDAQIVDFGGSPGIRDAALLDSALGRPKNLFAYGEPDLAARAAAYAFGIARSHPFVDGNKRCSFSVCLTFVRLNGASFLADEADAIATWLALAGGRIDETMLADWLRQRIRAIG